MSRLEYVVLSIFLLYAASGCEVGVIDEASAPQSSALVADPTVMDGDPVTILRKEALMKRVAEKRRESPEFAAAMDGAYDGMASGERSKVQTEERPSPRDSAVEGVTDESGETGSPVEGVVAFSPSRESAGLRARINRGVDESDLEQPHDSVAVGKPVPSEPKPFSF